MIDSVLVDYASLRERRQAIVGRLRDRFAALGRPIEADIELAGLLDDWAAGVTDTAQSVKLILRPRRIPAPSGATIALNPPIGGRAPSQAQLLSELDRIADMLERPLSDSQDRV